MYGGIDDSQEYQDEGLQDERLQDDVVMQDDSWAVISAFFKEKGLVRQQLDSFNEFINTSMQEIVDENAEITVKPQSQHNPTQAEIEQKEYSLVFGQIYLSKPTANEADGETGALFPKDARLRGLTYALPWTPTSRLETHFLTF